MQHDYFQLLVQAAQQGRKNAFIDLCSLNEKKIYTLCVRMLKSEKLAREITVRIFLQAFENIKFVRDDTSFELWLKSIAVFSILEEIRTKEISNNLELSDSDFNIKSENLLENIILGFPDKERIIFIMNQLEGYSLDEINDFFYDSNPDEIKSIIKDTRRKIVEEMGNEL